MAQQNASEATETSNGVQQEEKICKIHQQLRRGNDAFYVPTVIAIGPYHHHKFQSMEDSKWQYLGRLLSRWGVDPKDFIPRVKSDFLSKYLSKAQNHYPDATELRKQIQDSKAQNHYADATELRKQIQDNKDSGNNKEDATQLKKQNEEFGEMMIGDGAFILEVLYKNHHRSNWDLEIWKVNCIFTDLLLLENQIPFSILRYIFDHGNPNGNPPTVVDLSCQFLKDVSTLKMKNKCPLAVHQIHHLLHLFHTLLNPIQGSNTSSPLLPSLSLSSSSARIRSPLLPSSPAEEEQNSPLSSCCISIHPWSECCCPPHPPFEAIPSATVLQEAGIQFKYKHEATTFLDISFSRGVMEIPYLYIDDRTETLLRNLIAYEQCCLTLEHHFVSPYIAIMDEIINTEEDVKILNQKDILQHGLGSDDAVAQLFNKLAKGVFVDLKQSYLSSLFEDVQAYSIKRCHRWRASLVRGYLYNPWVIISLIAGIIILIITITQFVISVIDFMNK